METQNYIVNIITIPNWSSYCYDNYSPPFPLFYNQYEFDTPNDHKMNRNACMALAICYYCLLVPKILSVLGEGVGIEEGIYAWYF